MEFELILATDGEWGLGKDGGIPWKCAADMAHFRTLTREAPQGQVNVCVMGRATWESLPDAVRPLPGRVNIVLSKSATFDHMDAYTARNWDRVCELVKGLKTMVNSVFVIGGAKVYGDALKLAHTKPTKYICKRIWHTVITGAYSCDVVLAEPWRAYLRDGAIVSKRILEENMAELHECVFIPPRNKEEDAYLELLQDILEHGEERGDRTGTGTRSLFGTPQLRFSLRGGVFPLLTTKRTFFRGIGEELLFFIRGDTNNAHLQEKGVHIWDKDTSAETLARRGLGHRREGDLGPAYGQQWRHFGAPYTDCDADYTGAGVDQLAECIRLIREEPESRRIIMCAWNPAQLSEMCLPPCHMLYQFYVGDGGTSLSCKMIQRSADMFLGVPFNIGSTALLTCLIAKLCGLEPKEIVVSFGDAHVYNNHVEQVCKQLSHRPFPFPRLRINRELESLEDIEKLETTDFELVDYVSYGTIKADMNF